MKIRLIKYYGKRSGSVLVLTIVTLTILVSLGIGMLAVAYGVRHRAIQLKNETAAMLAAEAGYEQAVFWMSQQQDVLTAIDQEAEGITGDLSFAGADCDYGIEFYTFRDARPVYKIVSNGHSGAFNRTVEVLVVQAITGWTMGKCKIPTGPTTTVAVNYICDGTGCETIDMPLHINKDASNPSSRDIYIIGDPQFLQRVTMGESRYTAGGTDLYSDVMDFFTAGIYFNQPDSRISDEASIQSKIDRFEDSTKAAYQFTPTAGTGGTYSASYLRLPAVQLEFFVDPCGVGKVRITNDCTVIGFKQNIDSRTYDYMIQAGSGGSTYERYYIYACHDRPSPDNRITRRIDDTYVTQSYGEVESQPGGQIYVNGNVIVGGSYDVNESGLPVGSTPNVVKDKVTVVATGNIWVANSTTVAGPRDANGVPTSDNPNVLGLFAKRAVKVIDPGMSEYASGGTNGYPGPATSATLPNYVPVANRTVGSTYIYNRSLPATVVVEAAITTGGGGWGAENVKRGSYGGRKTTNYPNNDTLTVRGTLNEAIRAIVGSGTNGYKKNYHLDARLLTGILPGDVGLQGKYIPAPAGWHDYRD